MSADSLPVPDSPEALTLTPPGCAAPTEEEWRQVDFMRSQAEKLFQSGNPGQQAQADQILQSLRIAFERIGYPIHDPRALHCALLVTATLATIISQNCDDCLAAAHAYDVHVVPGIEHFNLLLRSLLQSAGIRPPIQPGPDDHAPFGAVDGADQTSLTWRELEGD